MSCSVTLAWDDALTGYDFGAGHPLAPVRLDLTRSLAAELGVLALLTEVPVVAAPDEVLETVHDPAYVAAVRRAGSTLRAEPSAGLGIPDNPVFAGIHDASALIAGATLAASQALLDGATDHAVNIAGGLHHAMPDRASGFCVYNDPAIAIRAMLDAGVDRIAYVDVDAHHGDGVEAVFWDDPRVLTISLHESGRTLFPGTGFATETGGAGATGSAVNIALPAGTADAGWLRAFDTVVPPLLAAWRPEVLVSQHGADAHALDPLTHLMVSVDAQRRVVGSLHALAHDLCAGRWLAVGGGGYAVAAVVPRTWTHLLAEAAGSPIDAATPVPQRWRELARRRTGVNVPATMGDVARGSDPALDAAVDAAIEATTEAVFALHGLGET